MSPDPTQAEQKAINDATRIEQFLIDPVVADRVLALQKKYFDDFKSCKSADQRDAVGGKASALDDLLLELKKVVDAGVVAKTHVQRRQPRSSK